MMFSQGINARYVKIIVQNWSSHISMRAGVLGCLPPACVCPFGTPATGDDCPVDGATVCSSCMTQYNFTLENDVCVCPTGMTCIPMLASDDMIIQGSLGTRTYSTSWDSNHQNSHLDTGRTNGWCPRGDWSQIGAEPQTIDSEPWALFELPEETWIYGMVFQGAGQSGC